MSETEVRAHGRTVRVSCAGRDPQGAEAFRARGLFLAVPIEHVAQALGAAERPGDGQEPVAP